MGLWLCVHFVKGAIFKGLMTMNYSPCRWGLCLLFLLVVAGCAFVTGDRARPAPKITQEKKETKKKTKELPRLGFSIQAGAFGNVENAARLAETLQQGGLNATYFVAEKGIYKVQFGNFPSRQEAVMRAELLQAVGVIDAFYIVAPNDYTAARQRQLGDDYLREEIVRTAQRFLGIPYLWGGESKELGFDCSGLTMSVYQLNGLELPRTSYEQFDVGVLVKEGSLEKGDLVFFATTRSGKISHVGVYVGEGRFIHAPGRGKRIRTDNLSQAYYRKHYRGGRSYI